MSRSRQRPAGRLGPRFALLGPPLAWLATAAVSPSPAGVTNSPSSQPSPTPTAAPTASAGQLTLSPTLGPPGTKATVQGVRFGAREQVRIYWDTPDKNLGTVPADASGAFMTDIEIPDSSPGDHFVCAVEPDRVCARFQLEAKASPSPSDAVSPTAPPIPTATAAPTGAPLAGASPPPRLDQVSAVSVLLQPPFVFFPILLLVGLIGGCVLWIWNGSRPRARPIGAALVTHRSTPPTSPVAGPASPAGREPPPPSPPPVRPRAAPGDETLDLPEPGE